MVTRSAPQASDVRSSADRRSLLSIGAVTTALAGLHLADHVLRGRQKTALAPTPPRQAKAKTAVATLSVRCPGCENHFKAKVELVGKKVRCPRCGKGVLIPAAGEGEVGHTS